MNKRFFAVPALLAAFLIIVSTGCQKDPSSIRIALQTTAQATSLYGLQKWGKEKPDAAKECANALKTNIETDLLPYLNGSQLKSSAEIAQLLSSSLFKKVDPDLIALIETAAIALDAVLPVPSAKKYLNKDEIGYVKAFLTGLAAGCDQYLGNKTMTAAVKKSAWIDSSKAKK